MRAILGQNPESVQNTQQVDEKPENTQEVEEKPIPAEGSDLQSPSAAGNAMDEVGELKSERISEEASLTNEKSEEEKRREDGEIYRTRS